MWYYCSECRSAEDKSDDTKDRFYKELGHVFDQFLKYYRKILFGNVNAKVGREDIFKPTIRIESLREISIDSRVPHKKKSYCQDYNVTTSQHS
jgi:hypothetical protein